MADIFDQIHAQSQTKPQSDGGDIFDQIHASQQQAQPSAIKKHGFFDPVDPKLIDANAPDALLPRSDNPYGKAVVDNMTGGFSDMGNGEYSRGAHKLITGAGIAAAPLALPFTVAAPAAAVGAGLVGYGTGKLARGVADIAGATSDQKDLAEDFGNFAGGPVGGVAFESPAVRGFAKGALSAVPEKLPAMAVGGGLLGSHLPPWLTAAGEAAYALPDMIRSGIAGSRGRLPFGPVTESLMPHAPLPQRPAFQEHDFTPPIFEDTRTSGTPGAVLPSGRVVGPAPPSRINPPEPRGNGPRVPGWQQMPITGERPLPASEFSPTYPSTPILESGRVIGPRPTLDSPPNGATVVNGPQLVTSKVETAPVSPAPLQSFGVPRIGHTPGERIAAISQSPEGTVGTRAEMMRQLRLADQSGASAPEKAAIIRRFEAPEYTQRPDRPFFDPREPQIIAKPLPSLTADTPATVRARANASRAKFDENGKRNQLK